MEPGGIRASPCAHCNTHGLRKAREESTAQVTQAGLGFFPEKSEMGLTKASFLRSTDESSRMVSASTFTNTVPRKRNLVAGRELPETGIVCGVENFPEMPGECVARQRPEEWLSLNMQVYLKL